MLMRILKNYTAHFVFENGDALISKKNQLYHYILIEDRIEHIITIPYQKNLKCFLKHPWLVRLFRAEIYHAVATRNNYIIVFFDGRILTVKNNEIINEYKITTGKRPLNVYFDVKSDLVIWGEYIDSKNRFEISIIQSKDEGQSWQKIYTYPKGSIKHIHNIIYDRYRYCYWILTGDDDHESGIWKTINFTNIEPFLIGSQKYRSVEIVPDKNGLIIPSDTEREINFIRYYSFKDDDISALKEVAGSCFSCKKINSLFFVTTMFEPSNVNRNRNIELWISRDSKSWELLYSIKKDFLPPRYFQYPLVKIPLYKKYDSVPLYFSTRATKKGSHCYIIGKEEVEEIYEWKPDKRQKKLSALK